MRWLRASRAFETEPHSSHRLARWGMGVAPVRNTAADEPLLITGGPMLWVRGGVGAWIQLWWSRSPFWSAR
jgi:hypothetical protein